MFNSGVCCTIITVCCLDTCMNLASSLPLRQSFLGHLPSILRDAGDHHVGPVRNVQKETSADASSHLLPGGMWMKRELERQEPQQQTGTAEQVALNETSSCLPFLFFYKIRARNVALKIQNKSWELTACGCSPFYTQQKSLNLSR